MLLTSEKISTIKSQVVLLANKLNQKINGQVVHHFKDDGSEMTHLDQDIHDLLKKILDPPILSEEGEHLLNFPTYVLDPIDGTRDLSMGLAECAVSLAYLYGPNIKDAHGLIFNPFTGFSISTHDEFSSLLTKPVTQVAPWCGVVSRSEYEKGLFRFVAGNDQVRVVPRGSIAFKLGLLASGACDFVVTLQPKSIWDIAAGTILCSQRGIKLYASRGEISSFNSIRFSGPLLWCRPELRDFLWNIFNP